VAITGDDTPLESVDAEVMSPRGEPVAQLLAAYEPSLDELMATFHLGSSNVSTLRDVSTISRFGSVHKDTGEVLAIERLPGRLSLANFDKLEVAMGVRFTSGSAPKERYAT
jgi:hypothetical protein